MELKVIKSRITSLNDKREVALEIAIGLIVSILISYIIDITIWQEYKGMVHTILELICNIVAMSAFLTFWFTSKYYSSQNYILTFGFLIIVAFNLLHTVFFFGLNLYPHGENDLCIKFYIAGSIVEALVFVFGIKETNKIVKNKWIALCISNIIIFIVSFILLKFPKLFPPLLTPALGVTSAKVLVEYLLILIYFLALYKLITSYDERITIHYKYLFVAIIFSIFSEWSFAIYSSPNSVFFIFGHVFKIVGFSYIYKGVFESSVTYPYKQVKKIMGEDMIRGAFDYVNIGVIISDLEANIINANKHFCEMLGYSKDELINLTYKDITFKGDKYFDKSFVTELTNLKIPKFSFEKRYVHKSGHEVWVSINDNIVYDEKGNPLYIVTDVQDISAKKKIAQLEEEIKKDKIIIEEALELDKLRTEFFANLSHELRTPLNVIIGALQLNEYYISQNSRNCLDLIIKNNKSIKQNCRRLLRLINNLIDTTKIDSGFYQLKLTNVNIVSIVEDITGSVVGFTIAKGIELIFDTDIEEKIIACDPDKIERIMLNLLSNAIKFTKPNGTVYVNFYDGIENVVISVKDNGIGIPRDMQTLIFERFRQVDKSFTRNQEGSGIGLSLVKSLVELHGGKIDLKSEEGCGSEFIITMPVRTVEANEEEQDKISSMDLVERVQVEFSDIYTYF